VTAKVAFGAVVAFSAIPLAWAQPPDAVALVRQSIQNYERDWREAMSWEYQQTDVMHSDSTKETDVSEITPVGGTPYERLILKDGQPLSKEQQKKEEHKFNKVSRQREEETPAERLERVHKYESERAFIRDIPDAYSYRITGEEAVNGRPAWVVKLAPKPGFVPTAPRGSMLGHIQGTLWIDKEDVQWAKAEAEVIDTIEIGWIMARIGPGAHFSVEQTRVADGFWMPARIAIQGSARVLMVHNKLLNEELTFSGYRKCAQPNGSPI